MHARAFGTLVAAALAAFAATNARSAGDKAAPAAPGGKCVHNCQGYADCKGNGNNSCKGKNDCSNTGLVPKACSSQKAEDACKKVTDAKKNAMCTWYEG
jgi:hypothetical protein